MQKREFYRAAYFLENLKDNSEFDRFMYYFARYLACEHNRLENDADAIFRQEKFDYSEMISLHNELNELGSMNPSFFDVFLMYILGKIRVSLRLKEEAKIAFLECLKFNRAFWPAWEALVNLIGSIEEAGKYEYIDSDHWMYQFFKADIFFRMNLHKNALDQYERISEAGFTNMPHILNEIAACLNYLQEHDLSLEIFKKVRKMDPYRVDQMHLFSDSLYVRSLRSDLSYLAHSFYKTHKFKWETCYIVANYYSLRGEHDRAVTFLQRCLKLNPQNSSAWTLIGHESMEQKNHSAACLAYRRAIEIDPMDYRGWYGLGQLYDILKLSSYSLYYYHKAHKCKADDSRMLVALGEAYSDLMRYNDAQKCYLRAFKVGDVEGTALMLLGKLYEKEMNTSQAALVYEKYLNVYGEELINDGEDVAYCCIFLARYYMNKGDLDTSSSFAQRCLEFDLTKVEGRNILSLISQSHHRMSLIPSSTHIAITSTPSVTAPIAGDKQLPSDAMITPILPKVTVSAPLQFRSPAQDDGEVDMLISSEDDSD
ncbi:unnamed protein product [Dracunculus medinensis]|uniref:TPR_REGION domain-containing protein n=1 Tax=Dracunculus medinensis TaxID=318479 RepID=A0A0N4U294_DRAME|nr:unnamed protein product [Dracunculus medinensis]